MDITPDTSRTTAHVFERSALPLPMHRPVPLAPVVSASVFLALALGPALARAQESPLPESVVVGGFTFRPSAELRIRSEFRRYPVDTGGNMYSSNAVLAEGFVSALPPLVGTMDKVDNQWFIGERARLGISVERGPMTGVFTLQDARLWGNNSTIFIGGGESALPETAPYEAYVDLHTRAGRRAYVRLGRQRVAWGDGRLVGANDWSFTSRSLDALRAGVQLGNVDLEAIAVLLAGPGGTPPSIAGTRKPVIAGTGAQLYGVDAVWHLAPLLSFELTTLARVVREPRPAWLTPSDILVFDGRAFGDRRGFRYALEGAYELGRVATYTSDRDVRAFALAARAELETALPGDLTFKARGAYASGDDGSIGPSTTQHRFDPILPDEHENLGPMGLYGWSNLIEGGGGARVRPVDELSINVGYSFAGLASPKGRWVTAALLPVGSVPNNRSRVLGHELDASVSFQPWDPLRIDLGYGLFLFGNAAKGILSQAGRALNDAGRAASLQHWAFLQTTLRAP